MKKNISKILASILCAATLMTNASTVMADTAHWRFDFQKGDTHTCGPVLKSDYEQTAYVTISKDDNPYFEEGRSVLELTVRDIYGNDVTDQKKYSSYGRKTINYTSYGVARDRYYLRGRVASTSGTQWIRVGGYWTP